MAICSHAISAQATVGEGTIFFHHGLGIVIHEDTVIGRNCKVFQNVTIGEKHSPRENEHGVPIIGDNVMIGAGAVILGNILIGNNAVIGANAVILHSVVENDVVCGVPGKKVKYGQRNQNLQKN